MLIDKILKNGVFFALSGSNSQKDHGPNEVFPIAF